MALVVGDRAATARQALYIPQYPLCALAFSTVTASTGSTRRALADNGNYAPAPDVAAFDKIDPAAFVFRVVRPAGVSSPEYRGIVVGHYTRQPSGTGTISAPIYLVKLLNGPGYYEILATEVEDV